MTETAIASLTASRVWREGKLVDQDVTPTELSAAVADPSSLVWIDLLSPSLSDLQAVIGRIGLPPTALEDLLGRRERPKVVQHPDWVYVTTHAVSREPDQPGDDTPGGHHLVRSPVSAIATDTALVTIRLEPRWGMEDVLRRWDADPGLTRRGIAALLHGLLDTIVDEHFDTIQELDDEAEELEDILLEERPTDEGFILRVYALRKELVTLRRVVVPMREVVTGIQHHPQLAPPEMAPWWGDLYDHVLRAAEWADSLRDMVAFLVETQMSLMDWRLNTVMKKLAGWAAIIAVPTLVTGWFGQNVLFPGYGTWAGLWVSLGLVAVSTATLYSTFKKRDWL